MEQQSISIATIAISTGSAIVASTVTSAVAVWLAMMRFRADKWWERKHASYTKLLRILHRMVRYTLAHMVDETGENGMSPEEREEWLAEWKTLSAEYGEVKDLADFDMSQDAIKALEQYEAEKSAARNDDDVDEWMRGDLKASIRCLRAIKVAARRDLRIR